MKAIVVLKLKGVSKKIRLNVSITFDEFKKKICEVFDNKVTPNPTPDTLIMVFRSKEIVKNNFSLKKIVDNNGEGKVVLITCAVIQQNSKYEIVTKLESDVKRFFLKEINISTRELKEKILKIFNEKNITPRKLILVTRGIELTETCTLKNVMKKFDNKKKITILCGVVSIGGGRIKNIVNTNSGEKKINNASIRTTNRVKETLQIGGTCYAHAVTSAYLNAASRIYGLKLPSFKEVYQIAEYSKNGGYVEEAYKRVENHFKFGIIMKRDYPYIKDVLAFSCICCFATTKDGWKDIAKGEHFDVKEGESDGRHACYVEGIDLNHDQTILKNSWGSNKLYGRFKCVLRTLRKVKWFTLYYTLTSISHLKLEKYPGKILLYKSIFYKGKNYSAVVMNKIEAKHNSKYFVLEDFLEFQNDDDKFIGIDVNDYIKIQKWIGNLIGKQKLEKLLICHDCYNVI